MSFDPEGRVGKQVKPILVQELTSRFNIPEEADDVAEYILVLISGNKTPLEIATEVKELSDIAIDENFVQSLFMEIKKLMEQGEGGQAHQAAVQPPAQPVQQQVQQSAQPAQPVQQQFQQPVQQQQQPQQFQQVQQVQQPALPTQPDQQQPQQQIQFQPQNMTPNQTNEMKSTSPDAMQQDHVDFSMPTNPRYNFKKGPSGVTKGKTGFKKQPPNSKFKKSYGMQNPANFEKMLGFGETKFVTRPPKGRCTNFPGCTNKECKFAHPTKVCNAFPNCPNKPGTCNFLHPGEDEELMAKLEVSKQEYLERRKRNPGHGHQNFAPQETGIAICKFGVLCSKDLCPFGHPTPANIEAKVFELIWCSEGKKCVNNNCTKAHPSPGYLSANAPHSAGPHLAAPSFNAGPAKTLEQCKYGLSCTNLKCPRRHATSSVPCKSGANCQNIDCTYMHPIDEECRFGANCGNKTCSYKHAGGKALPSNTWVKGAETNQRGFAVPDDQVERADQPSMVQ